MKYSRLSAVAMEERVLSGLKRRKLRKKKRRENKNIGAVWTAKINEKDAALRIPLFKYLNRP